MENKMNNFLTKAGALVFAFLSVPTFAAAPLHVGTLIDDVRTGIDDIRNPATAVTAIPTDLPIHQCVLDFSDTIPILISTAKLGSYLVSEQSEGKLDLIDIAYLTMEGLAAGARKESNKFGAFASYVADEDVMFNTFARSIGRIRTAEHDLSVLGNLATCQKFVRDTITLDLPIVLEELLKTTAVPILNKNKAEIANGIVALMKTDPVGFIPMFAKLLNASYNGLSGAAAMVTADIQVIKEKVSSGCGCFGK